MSKNKKQAGGYRYTFSAIVSLALLFVLLSGSLVAASKRSNYEPSTNFIQRWLKSFTLQPIGEKQTFVGLNGERGPRGLDGSDGIPGLDGEQGPIGLTGATGNDGADGTNGTDGANGADGADGADGCSGDCVALQAATPGVAQTGHINVDGTIIAGFLEGEGSGLTALNGDNVASGTLDEARLSTNVTLQGNTFNGASQLVQLTAGGLLPALSGVNLTALNASNISSGTLGDGRLSANVALLDGTGPQTFTGNNKITGTLTVGASGTALNQIKIYSATIDPANVGAASTSEQTFSVTGLSTSDKVVVNQPSHTSGCGIVNARVSAPDTLALTFVNVLAALGCNPPSETYNIIAIQ